MQAGIEEAGHDLKASEEALDQAATDVAAGDRGGKSDDTGSMGGGGRGKKKRRRKKKNAAAASVARASENFAPNPILCIPGQSLAEAEAEQAAREAAVAELVAAEEAAEAEVARAAEKRNR